MFTIVIVVFVDPQHAERAYRTQHTESAYRTQQAIGRAQNAGESICCAEAKERGRGVVYA